MATFANISLSKRTVLGVSCGSAALLGVPYLIYRELKARKAPKYYIDIDHVSEHGDKRDIPNGRLCMQQNDIRTTSTPTASLRHSSQKERSVTSSGTSATLTQEVLDATEDAESIEKLCEAGLDAFHNAIRFWENAIVQLETEDHIMDHPNSTKLQHELSELLRKAKMIQVEFERKLSRDIDHTAVDMAMVAIQQMDRDFELERRAAASSTSDSIETESFASATDLADLSDLDRHAEMFDYLVLYKSALLELKYNTIPCRTLRTKWAGCLSDTEFLAKVHCLRLGFNELLSDESIRNWLESQSRFVLGALITKAQRDPSYFYQNFEELSAYAKDPNNLESIKEELRDRGVKHASFYDVVLDFILMDAFDDLVDPPSSLISVMNNRWLSDGFKERALSTAVWSVLRAKRAMLRHKDGFISRFYTISEQISPALAWGFFGTSRPLRELCYSFKDDIMAMINEFFSFETVHYNHLDQMTSDLLDILRKYDRILAAKLSEDIL